MSTKTLTITKEAYELLALQKQKNESFSEVIVRTYSPNKALWNLVGLLSDKEADSLEGRIQENRKAFAKSMNERLKENRGALSQ